MAITMKSTKERSTGRDMFFTVIKLGSWMWGGRELCLTRGLEGGDWNVTAECQTLCPDGIITDSRKAALHNSASSLPQHRNTKNTKNGTS